MAEALYAATYNPAVELHGLAELRQVPYAEFKAGVDRLAWLRDCLEQLGGVDRGADLHDE